MRPILAFLIIVFVSIAARAEPLRPAPDGTSVFLGQYLEFLDAKDDSADLAWAQHPSRSGEWRKGEQDVLSFGVWRAAVWLRLTLRGNGDSFYLVLRNARTETVALYLPDGGGHRVSRAGMSGTAGDAALPFRYPTFQFDLPTDRDVTVYVRAENRGALRLDLRLMGANEFRALETNDHLILGIMFGVLGAVALYAFLAWRSLNERASLLLSLFVTSLGAYLGYQTGLAPTAFGYGGVLILGLIFAVAATISGSLFGDEFLELKRTHGRLHVVVLAYAASMLLFLPLYGINVRWALALLPIYIACGAMLHLYIGWRSWRSGGATGRDWLIAWTTILMAVASHAFIEMRVIPLNAITANLVYIGAVAGSLTFAAALSGAHRRKRDEIVRAVRESEERFALASRGAYDGLFDIDLAKGKAYYAPRLHELLGLADGAMGDDVEALRERIHPEDAKNFEATLIRAMRSERRRFEGAFRVRRTDGEVRWMAVRALIIYSDNRRAIRHVGSIRDITEARRTGERLSVAIGSIADGFALFGPDDVIIECNDAFAALYGSRANDLKGKSYEDLIGLAATLHFGHDRQTPERDSWLAYRRAVHRAADGKPIETRFDDGRIYRVTERRTPDGGTVLLRTDISELVSALSNAKSSEERLRNILDSIPARVAMVDRARRFRFVNRQYCDAYGLPMEQIVGRPVAEVIGQGALTGRTDLGDRALAGETVHAEDWVPYARIGTRYVLRVYTPSRAVDGSVDGFYVFAIDRTAQKEAEAQHIEAEALRRTFIESAVDCFIAMDDRGQIVEFNPAAERTFGVSRERAIGADVANIVMPERFRAAHRAGLKRIVETGESKLIGKTIEVPALRADGTEFPAELTLTASRFAGKPYFSAYLRDVTERKKAEQALAASESRYALALKGSRDGIYDWDFVRNTAYVSPRFLEIFGLDPAGAGQVDVAIVRHMILRDDMAQAFEKTKDLLKGASDTAEHEVRIRRADGEVRWTHIHAAVERDANGRVTRLCASIGDITERKELERQLLQSQKMEALGQLAGGIAHDFNNVLSVISGYATLARRLSPADGEAAQHLARILEGVTRAAGMTREMLAFGRRTAYRAQVVDLRRLVRDQSSMLAPLLGAQVKLGIKADGPPIKVKVDPNIFAQVIMNLAINARDAMPDGGPLDIVVEPEKGGMVRLFVADMGTGMDEATQRRIFEPFFTTKAPGAGTGLGLAMVYGTVTQSGGKISVESALGKGSRFVIDLPTTDEPLVVEIDDGPATGAAQSGKGKTILLAEDEDLLRDVLIRALEDAGYRVLAAENGVAALEILDGLEEEADPALGRLDLLLTDLVMPELGGIKLASLATELRPGLPVLYMTGYPSRGGFQTGDIPKGATVLDKPIDIDRLVRTIAATLEQSRKSKKDIG